MKINVYFVANTVFFFYLFLFPTICIKVISYHMTYEETVTRHH